MHKNLKKVMSLSLTAVISLSCFIAPAFAATSQASLANEYAELKSAPAVSTYTMASGNKTMLDLTDSKALPTADDWWSNRIRDASKVAYLNLDEASPEMRAVILTARYEIVLSKSWVIDAVHAGNTGMSLFYDLFPTDWSVPAVNNDGYVFDAVLNEFVPPAYISDVYNQPDYSEFEMTSVKDAEIALNTIASATTPAPSFMPMREIFYGTRYVSLSSPILLIGNKWTSGVLYNIYGRGFAVPPYPFVQFAIESRQADTGQVQCVGYVGESAGEYVPVYVLPSLQPENINIYVRAASVSGPVTIQLLEE